MEWTGSGSGLGEAIRKAKSSVGWRKVVSRSPSVPHRPSRLRDTLSEVNLPIVREIDSYLRLGKQ